MHLNAIDWSSSESHLLLNPRLSDAHRAILTSAWQRHVATALKSHVGIATSGSSSNFGKLILLSKNALLVSAAAANERLASTSSDIWMKTLPEFHVGGLGIWARAHLSGAKVTESKFQVSHAATSNKGSGSAFKWNASMFLQELEASGATLLSLVPSQLFDLVMLKRRAPRSLRFVVIGGARLSEELRLQSLDLGWPVLPSYGMTECASQIATARTPEAPELFPLSHVEVRAREGQSLEIRSRSLLTSFIAFDQKGESVMIDPKVDGWFRVEDRVTVEPNGALKILGRSQDFVKIGGEGVVLSRLDETLEQLRVEKGYQFGCAVLAARDARLGAVIVMISEGNNDQTQELVNIFNHRVMPYEKIRKIFRVPELPRSPLGKLLRSSALTLVGLEPLTDS